jgi:hypothetical protein
MYEEYQNNPNPGFDPRQRYEDAGGYLRSVLGSFLTQKRDSEDRAIEESRFKRQLEAQEEQSRLTRKANDSMTKRLNAEGAVEARRPDLRPGTPEYESAVDAYMGIPRESTYERLMGQAAANQAVAAGAGLTGQDATDYTTLGPGGVTKIRTTNTEVGGRGEVAKTNAEADVKVAGIRGPSSQPRAEKPVKPVPTVTFADKKAIEEAAAAIDVAIAVNSKAGTPESVEATQLLRGAAKILRQYGAKAMTETLTADQLKAIDELKATGQGLTPQRASELITRITNPTVAPAGGPGLVSDSRPEGTERVLNIDGKRYLEDADGELYEMVMG